MKAAIDRCRLAARQLGAGEPLLYTTRHWSAETIKDQNAEAGVLASLGGKLLLRAKTSVVNGLSNDDRRGCLANYAALMTSDDDATADTVRQFKALGKDRVALLDMSYPDRYAMGFRPAVLGADGAAAGAILLPGPIYDGMDRVGRALAVADNERALTPTVGLLLLRQGVDDLTLWKQCARDLAAADQAGFTGPEAAALRKTMAGIQSKVSATRASATPDCLADAHITARQMNQWRASLIDKLAALTKARPTKK